MAQKITISYKTIFLAIISVLGVWLAYQLRSVILVIFLAFILNAGLRPIVKFLTTKFRFRRGVAILITYLFILLSIVLSISVIIGAAIEQISQFVTTLPVRIDNLVDFIQQVPILDQYINTTDLINSLNQSNLLNISPERIYDIIFGAINTIGFQGIAILGSVVGFFFNVLLIVIISIYMIQNEKNVYQGVLELMPIKHAKRLSPILTKIENSLGSWLLGQAILMFAIGVGAYISLQIPRLFDVNYHTYEFALVIAIVAALLEAIPNIGPTITLIIAVIIAILTGASVPILIFIVVAFIVIQQLEGLYLVPRIMNRAIDLNPVVTIAGVTAGFELGGPLGALISVPILGVIQIVVKELSTEWKKSEDSK